VFRHAGCEWPGMDFRIDDLLEELAQEWANQGRTNGDLAAFAAQRELAAARGLFAAAAQDGALPEPISAGEPVRPALNLPRADALGKEILRLAMLAAIEHRAAVGGGAGDLGTSGR
jgi:hypothetical protein